MFPGYDWGFAHAFSVLNLDQETTSYKQFTARYRELVKKWHPDRNRGNEEDASKQFMQIVDAKRLLEGSFFNVTDVESWPCSEEEEKQSSRDQIKTQTAEISRLRASPRDTFGDKEKEVARHAAQTQNQQEINQGLREQSHKQQTHVQQTAFERQLHGRDMTIAALWAQLRDKDQLIERSRAELEAKSTSISQQRMQYRQCVDKLTQRDREFQEQKKQLHALREEFESLQISSLLRIRDTIEQMNTKEKERNECNLKFHEQSKQLSALREELKTLKEGLDEDSDIEFLLGKDEATLLDFEQQVRDNVKQLNAKEAALERMRELLSAKGKEFNLLKRRCLEDRLESTEVLRRATANLSIKHKGNMQRTQKRMQCVEEELRDTKHNCAELKRQMKREREVAGETRHKLTEQLQIKRDMLRAHCAEITQLQTLNSEALRHRDAAEADCEKASRSCRRAEGNLKSARDVLHDRNVELDEQIRAVRAARGDHLQLQGHFDIVTGHQRALLAEVEQWRNGTLERRAEKIRIEPGNQPRPTLPSTFKMSQFHLGFGVCVALLCLVVHAMCLWSLVQCAKSHTTGACQTHLQQGTFCTQRRDQLRGETLFPNQMCYVLKAKTCNYNCCSSEAEDFDNFDSHN